MSYMIAFREEDEKQEAMEKLCEAKMALMEACKMFEDADQETSMNERGGRYRGSSYSERRGRAHYRGGRYREDMGGTPMPAEGRYDY